MRRGSDADSERGVTRASTSAGDAGESQVSLETLLADVTEETVTTDRDTTGVRLLPEQDAEVVYDEVIDRLGFDSAFMLEDAIIKDNLSELLLVLIALREDGTHGKALKQDLATLFDAHLSPGTVYPALHALEEAGALEVQELVQTKQYVVDDKAMTTEKLRRAMRQHLALGMVFADALARVERE